MTVKSEVTFYSSSCFTHKLKETFLRCEDDSISDG